MSTLVSELYVMQFFFENSRTPSIHLHTITPTNSMQIVAYKPETYVMAILSSRARRVWALPNLSQIASVTLLSIEGIN